MSKRLALVVLAFLLAFAPPARSAPEAVVQGELIQRDGMPVLRLWGTPQQRGFAHGYLLAKDIIEGTDKSLAAFFGKRMEVYSHRMLPAAKAAFRITDDEKAELEGLLAGIEARLPEPKARTLTCLSRVATYDDLFALNVFGDLYALGCSSLAIWGEWTKDGKAMVGRSFDFPALDIVAGRQHVRVVAPVATAKETPGRCGYVGIGHPGGIGIITGLSSRGVFAAIHDVHVTPALKDLAQGNVPRLIAIRRLLEQLNAEGAVEAAVELCRGWNTLYGNNFMVATPTPGDGLPAGILEYDTRESDDKGVDLRGPAASMSFVCCTNHHCIRGTGACGRFDRLQDAYDDGETKVVTPEALFTVIGRAAFPKKNETIKPGRLGTIHQVVAETGDARLHVRMAGIGGNIRKSTSVVFDVAKALSAIAGDAD